MRLLITGPDLTDPGGVAGFYRSVLPKLQEALGADSVCYVEIGSTVRNRHGHRMPDPIHVHSVARAFRPTHALVNPSLNFASVVRDGLISRVLTQRGMATTVFFRGWNLEFEDQVDRFGRLLFKACFGGATSCLVLASQFANSLQAWLPGMPVSLATTTVDVSLEQALHTEPQMAPEGGPVDLLFMSRLVDRKGLIPTIEAMERLRARNLPVRLLVAGDGPLLEAAKRLVASRGLEETVVFLGYVSGEEKLRALGGCQVFVFPSTYGEGMPNAVLEAMYAGCALVTTPVGGIADFFRSPDMGVLLESDAPDQIASQIEALVSDRGHLERVLTANAAYAVQNFTAGVVASKLLDHLRNPEQTRWLVSEGQNKRAHIGYQ